jgi:Nitroreductase
MDILTALHSRRSVRSYNSQKVTEEELKTILAAGMTAPSAGNAQPWHMVVVDDPVLLAQVPSINPYAAMAQKSPVSVLVCGNTTLEKYPGFWVQDCAAAIQNMLLAATSLGIGSVWTGIYPMAERVNKFQELFKLPAHIIPHALLVFGHVDDPAAAFAHKNRYDTAKVSRNDTFGQGGL